jgi:ClpP class serine protease
VQVFRTGELKAAGYPGTSLSEAEAAHFQDLVDGVGMDFQTWVLEYRPGIDLGLFDGRAVSGKQGLDLGLVDAIHNTRQEAIQQFMEVFA